MLALSTDENRRRLIAAIASVGGAVVIAGALLPWLTVFQGLDSYAGILGLNGQLLAAGGSATIVLAVVYTLRPRTALRYGVGFLGFALALFSAYLLAQLLVTYHSLRGMFLPALGPGVFVAAGGAIMILGTLFIEAAPERDRAARPKYLGANAVTLATLSAGAAAIHLSVAGDHFHEYLLYGVFFVVLGLAQTLWAALVVLFGPTRQLLIAGIANAGVVTLWVASRTTGLPVGPHPRTSEAIGFPDVTASVFELGLVGLAVWSLWRPAREPNHVFGRLRWALPLAVSPTAVAAVLVAVGAIGQG
jgi:MFS family permease